MREAFTGNFLDSSDLMGKGNVTVTISDVVPPGVEKDAAKKTIDKPIIAFEKTSKRLVLGKVNMKILKMQHGDKASEWIGKKITLCVRYLEKAFGQTNVPTIRLVPDADKPMTFGMRKNYGAEHPYRVNEDGR
jgi:hypothetical protein